MSHFDTQEIHDLPDHGDDQYRDNLIEADVDNLVTVMDDDGRQYAMTPEDARAFERADAQSDLIWSFVASGALALMVGAFAFIG